MADIEYYLKKAQANDKANGVKSGTPKDPYLKKARANDEGKAGPKVTQATDYGKVTEGEFNRSSAMQQKYGSYQNYLVGATADGKYYSQPKFGADTERLKNDYTAYGRDTEKALGAYQNAEALVKDTETALTRQETTLQELEKGRNQSPSALGDTVYNIAVQKYNDLVNQYNQQAAAAAEAYSGYEQMYGRYTAAVDAYNAYQTEQGTLYQNWKGTIRQDETAINADITAAQANVKALEDQQEELNRQARELMNKASSRQGSTSELMQWSQQAQQLMAQANGMDGQITEAKKAMGLLQEELSWAKYYKYDDLAAENRELGQYGAGNIDLYNRPQYQNPDGSISTVDSISFDIDGKEVLLPTVWVKNGKAYHSADDDEILQHYYDTGEYLGKFDTPEEADAYGEKLHKAQDFYYGSRYKSTANGREVTYTPDGTLHILEDGYDDILYDYINGDREAQDRQDYEDSRLQGTHEMWKDLDPDIVSIFNYLYAQDEEKGDREHTRAYEFIDEMVPRQYTAVETGVNHFIENVGIMPLLTTAVSGVAAVTNDDELKMQNKEGRTEWKETLGASAQQHPIAATAGGVTGSMALMAAAGAGTAGITAGINTAVGATAARGAISYAMTAAVQQSGDVATGIITPAQYGKKILVQAAQGAAGNIAGELVSIKIANVLAEKQLMTPFMEFIRQTSRGMADSLTGNTVSYLLSEEKPTSRELAENLATSFAFSIVFGAADALKTVNEWDAETANLATQLGEVYNKLCAEGAGLTPDAQAEYANKLSGLTQELQRRLRGRYVPGQQKKMDQIDGALTIIDGWLKGVETETGYKGIQAGAAAQDAAGLTKKIADAITRGAEEGLENRAVGVPEEAGTITQPARDITLPTAGGIVLPTAEETGGIVLPTAETAPGENVTLPGYKEAASGQETAVVIKNLQDSIPQLSEMEPVAEVSSGGIQSIEGRTMADKAKKLFDNIIGTVTRKGFGDIEINKRSAKDDLSHGVGLAKAAVIPAIPEVLKSGKQIAFEEKWKGRPYDGYVFAAPVELDGTPTYVAAVVKQTAKNKLYLHEVVDSNGNIIKIGSGAETNPTSLAAESGAGVSTPLPAATVSQNGAGVNGIVLPTAEQGRVTLPGGEVTPENTQNGGMNNEGQAENVQRRTDGKEIALEGENTVYGGDTGGGSPYADTGRTYGIPEGVKGLSRENRELTLKRQRAVEDAPLVSSADMGIENGTEEMSLRILPEEDWDDELLKLRDWAQSKGIKSIRAVVGMLTVDQGDGSVSVMDVINKDTGELVIRADSLSRSATETMVHAVGHYITDEDAVRRFMGEIKGRKAAAWQQMYQVYKERWAQLTNYYEDMTDEEIELYVWEEIMEDAYAEINNYGERASTFHKEAAAILEGTGEPEPFGEVSLREGENAAGAAGSRGPPRYMIAGEGGGNADINALATAKAMQQEGASEESILALTGWYQGIDGKWRWEIDDSGMKYNSRGDNHFRERYPEYTRYQELLDKANKAVLGLSEDALTESERIELDKLKNIWGTAVQEGQTKGERLGDFLKHDALFENYPELKEAKLAFEDLPEGENGFYDRKNDTVVLSDRLRRAPEATLLHEIQHAVQNAEGFAGGASPGYWNRRMEEGFSRRKNDGRIAKADKEYRRIFDNAPEEFKNKVREINRSRLAGDYDAAEAIVDELYDSEYADLWSQLDMADFERRSERGDELLPSDLYRNTAGEIEARETANRWKMTAEERRNSLPYRGDENTVFADGGAASLDYIGKTSDGIEVYETSKKVRKLPWKERKKRFLDIMQKKYKGRTAKFTRRGEVYYARFDEADLQKNIYGDDKSTPGGRDAKINTGADGNIFELVENAAYKGNSIESGKPTAAHKGVTAWDYFVKTVQIDGKVYDLLANVRKKPDGEFVYNLQLTENKETPASPVAVFANSNPASEWGTTDVSGHKIPEKAPYVKQKNSTEMDADQHKAAQYDIIRNSNAAPDEYHTWIRDPSEIKTLAEALADPEWAEYDSFDPDWTREMAQEALDTGKVTVYSSYPIVEGGFVTPSAMEAQSYSGNGNVYEKRVDLTDVAWIDPTQGQYAPAPSPEQVKSAADKNKLRFSVEDTGLAENTKNYKEELKEKFPLETLVKGNNKNNTETPAEETDTDKKPWKEQEEERNARSFKQREKERAAQLLRNVGRKDFKGTPALEKLGVKISNSVGIYQKTDSIRKSAEAARRISREIKKAERNLRATDAEKNFASGIAAGIYTAEDIPARLNEGVVIELADLYWAEQGVATNRLSEQRRAIKDALNEKMSLLLQDSNEHKVPAAAVLNYRTPERNMLQIFGDELGEKINAAVFDPVAENEAERYRFINRMHDEVRKFKDSKGKERALTKNERALVQKVIEGRAIGETVANMEMGESIRRAGENIKTGKTPEDAAKEFGLKYGDRKLAEKYSRWLSTQEELETADDVIVRNAADKYSELFNLFYDGINDFLVAHGYEPIGFIKGYAPHIQPEENQNLLNKAIQSLGISTEVTELPASIAGRTADFKPNKRWNPYFLTRNGDLTQFDIASAFESYVDYMSDVLYHTDDVMRVREMGNYLRRTYAPEEIRENISWAQNLRNASAAEKASFLRDSGALERTSVLSEQDINAQFEKYVDNQLANIKNTTKYSNLVSYLDNYANILAGKQSMADRGAEYAMGRKWLRLGNKINSAFGKANVAANLSSMLNQTAQVPMIKAELGERWTWAATIDFVMGKTAYEKWGKDSDFLTGKRGIDYLVNTTGEKVTSAMFWGAEAVDRTVSTIAVRGKYLKELHAGKSHDEAMKAADAFGKAVMGSRMKGSKPLAFHSKRFFTQLANMFQIEALNSWEHVTQDLPREARKIAKEKGKAAAAAWVARILVMGLIASFVLNRLSEETYGGTPAPFDLLGLTANFIASGEGLTTNDWIRTIIDNVWEEKFGERLFDTPELEDKPFDTEAAIKDTLYNISNDIPFLRNVSGLLGLGDATLPMPDLYGGIEGIADATGNYGFISPQNGKAGLDLITEMIPGGRQLSKTAQGIETVIRGGDYSGYGENEKLKYPLESTEDKVKAVLFGKYTTDAAQGYYASGDKMLSEKQTQVYSSLVDAGADSEEVYDAIQEYRDLENDDSISSYEKGVAQRNVIREMNLTDKQKLEMYRGLSSADSTAEKLKTIMDTGLTFDQAMDVLDEYKRLNGDEESTAAEQAADFAYWLDTEGFSGDKQTVIKEQFKFYSIVPTEAATYEKFTAAGLDAEAAKRMTEAIGNLEPPEGKKQVTDAQKWRAAIDAGESQEEQREALKAIMSETALEKYEIADSYGISPVSYVKLKEILPQFDADGNGAYKQEEVEAAIDSMGGGSGITLPGGDGDQKLTLVQQAVLWQLYTGSKSAKNNPYSTSIGQQVIDARSGGTGSLVLPG